MSVYKLTYFNVTTRGETTRMMFHMAGQEFEDVRIDVREQDEWNKIRYDITPFGWLPVLEVDGVQISESRAIERFVAKRFGFYGDTDIEQAKADMVVDYTEDMLLLLIDFLIADEAKKEQMSKRLKEEQVPRFLANIEKMTSEDGYINGKKLSWPDIRFYNFYHSTEPGLGGSVMATHIDKCPKIKLLLHNVETHPKIAEWIAKRPEDIRKSGNFKFKGKPGGFLHI